MIKRLVSSLYIKFYYFKKKIVAKSKIIIPILALLWIVISLLFISIIKKPNVKDEILQVNYIEQNTDFKLQALIKPYVLKPNGGIIDLDKFSFTKVTKDIILNINTIINSYEAVYINGKKKVLLNLIAPDLWEKEFILFPETSFNYQGNAMSIFDDDLSLDLSTITKFINDMEESIETRSGEYILDIKPIIEGTIQYKETIIPIDQSASTQLVLSFPQISLEGDVAFKKATPLTESSIIQQYVNIFNLNIPMQLIKSVFAVIYAMYTALLVYIIYLAFKSRRKLTETEIIEKKFKNRILPLKDDIGLDKYANVILSSFISLVKLSDEKDTFIIKYDNFIKKTINYYVIDGRFLYIYQILYDEQDITIQNKDVDIEGSAIA